MADDNPTQPPSGQPPSPQVEMAEVRIVDDPNAPIVYANGFGLGLGNADAHIDFVLGVKMVARLHLSYTLAKTLHQRLGQLIANFEARVERPMLTTSDVDTAFARKAK
jgi:hypothetical protein